MTTMASTMARALLSLFILQVLFMANSVARGETCAELTASYKNERKALKAMQRKQLALETKNDELDKARADLEAQDETLQSLSCPIPTDDVQNIGELVKSGLSGHCAELLEKAKKRNCLSDTSKASCLKFSFELCENECTHVEDVSECAAETGHVSGRCMKPVNEHKALSSRVNQLVEGVKRKRAALKAKEDLVRAIKLKMEKIGCPIPPEDGEWGAWAPWGACSKDCGVGSRSRSRQCDDPEPSNGGAPCSGSDSQTDSCITKACSINGNWGTWASWGACSKDCGGGSRSRGRKCDSPAPANGGQACSGSASDSGSCNEQSCSIDGNWGSWAAWGACSKDCGGGSRTRGRKCDSPAPAHGGRACSGSASDSGSCNEQSCSIDGNLGSWAAWGACSKDCGGGSRTRGRKCDSPAPAHGGQACSGSTSDTGSCNEQSCGVDGAWGSWSRWGGCSTICGGGSRSRNRNCDSPAPAHGGQTCSGSASESGHCNTYNCPRDGVWSAWTAWSACSSECGGGSRTRGRLCNSPAPMYGGKACAGEATVEEDCNTEACEPSTKIMRCESPGKYHFCGCFAKPTSITIKIKISVSACVAGVSYGISTDPTKPGFWVSGGCRADFYVFFGNAKANHQCKKVGRTKSGKTCQTWTDFGYKQSIGYPASNLCTTKNMLKEPWCYYDFSLYPGGWEPCVETCGDGNWNSWGSWSSCSKTCGSGSRTRSRKCDSPAPTYGGAACSGSASASASCNTQACPSTGAVTTKIQKCESWSYQYRFCSCTTMPTSLSVKTRFSSSACKLGYSCGLSKDPKKPGFWVSRGCRADFTVTYRSTIIISRPAPRPSPGLSCVGRRHGEIWRVPGVCDNMFNQCAWGRLIRRACPAGLVFNNSLRRCVFRHFTECKVTVVHRPHYHHGHHHHHIHFRG